MGKRDAAHRACVSRPSSDQHNIRFWENTTPMGIGSARGLLGLPRQGRRRRSNPTAKRAASHAEDGLQEPSRERPGVGFRMASLDHCVGTMTVCLHFSKVTDDSARERIASVCYGSAGGVIALLYYLSSIITLFIITTRVASVACTTCH